ncbi:hypothetical protein V1639_06140 [Pseudarthrobacter sp. J75]|uniref:LysM peptidoglycan-binding domain-containing protein n=1 Tax=unclassified Pseudarthrobacter TaxID=2647000 RepID=UPI002E8044B8|nr:MULTISPECIES: hypothetical protein [unclassified Pseudarthrobacter]MEE2521377.1 hypothetical protein [Pseudarthrobacter sp. J47]MEE2528609.1 hypothetical protein [Pseudarthrobacter sp. J75]
MGTDQEATPGRAADAAMAAVILALGVFLAANGLAMLERWRESSARRQSLQLEDVLGGLSAGVGTLIVAWWCMSLLAAFACAGLHKAGHDNAGTAVGKASPAFMRRLALAVLGIQLLAGPVAANAAPAAASDGVGISVEWAATAGSGAGAGPITSPEWSATQAPQDTGQPVQPQWKPAAPPSDPGMLAAPPLRAIPAGTPAAGQVTVLAGDSLWTIAARALGPHASDLDVALDWPRWYEANKAAIGDNPDVLLPGQILQAPSSA